MAGFSRGVLSKLGPHEYGSATTSLFNNVGQITKLSQIFICGMRFISTILISLNLGEPCGLGPHSVRCAPMFSPAEILIVKIFFFWRSEELSRLRISQLLTYQPYSGFPLNRGVVNGFPMKGVCRHYSDDLEIDRLSQER